jgi:peptide-methionine (S)-S-oxide reductase
MCVLLSRRGPVRASVILVLVWAWLASPPPAGAQQGRELATATFAGGCFWCVEEAFDKVEGVVSTTSGFTGGHVENPTYEQVVTGRTGHKEAVQVVYDPARVTYAELLEVFWFNIDPMDGGGQFCDRGPTYRSAIFYHDQAQKEAAERSKGMLEASGRLPHPIATEIIVATEFYSAEEYHQDYYQKNPIRYRFYKTSCGRERRLRAVWGTND